jgi:hypothetical protein
MYARETKTLIFVNICTDDLLYVLQPSVFSRIRGFILLSLGAPVSYPNHRLTELRAQIHWLAPPF